jgi:hypothetical protein
VPGTFTWFRRGRLDAFRSTAVSASASGVQYWSKRVSSYTSAGLRSNISSRRPVRDLVAENTLVAELFVELVEHVRRHAQRAVGL